MDREALRQAIADTLIAFYDWDHRNVADALLDGPLARLVDIAEKAEAFLVAMEDREGTYDAYHRLRAALGSPEGKP